MTPSPINLPPPSPDKPVPPAFPQEINWGRFMFSFLAPVAMSALMGTLAQALKVTWPIPFLAVAALLSGGYCAWLITVGAGERSLSSKFILFPMLAVVFGIACLSMSFLAGCCSAIAAT